MEFRTLRSPEREALLVLLDGWDVGDGWTGRDFFRRYPPSRVAFSEPSSSDDGQSATGRYWPETGGAPLNVRVLHRVDGEDWELSSIRIDRQPVVRTGGR